MTAEQHAKQIVEEMKKTRITIDWQPSFTTWIVGARMSASVNRILKSWGVLVAKDSGNYQVNYNAQVFQG